MSEVLYRKYRPQTFAQVLGQDVVKTVIQNAVRYGRVSHAYLFTGPRGVGKTTVARLLAKAVNCLAPKKDGEPDITCENCQLIQSGRFLDLLEIDAASYTGVDNIRDIIDHVKFAPSRGKYKVFIIDEVHMLSKAAFNALLKTLEEPPLHAIFILATTEVHKVPATIISRSQRFDFKRVSQADIMKLLEMVSKEIEVKLPQEAKVLIASAAEGSFRDALSILDQLLSLGAKEISYEEVEAVLGLTRVSASQNFLAYLISGDCAHATKFVKNLAFEGKDLVQFSRNFLEYLRLVLFVKMGIENVVELGFSPSESQDLKEQSKGLSAARLLEITKVFLEASRQIKISPVPELPLILAVLTLVPDKEANNRPDLKQEEVPGSVSKNPRQEEHNQDLNLGTILKRWAEILSRVKEYNQSLVSSLRLGRLMNFEGSELKVAFPYKFHKETVDARKNRIVVEQVLEEIFGQPIRIKVYVEQELGNKDSAVRDENKLLSEALRVLGNARED